MGELKDTADQFAKDLLAQNIAGLMMAFTPTGMGKAMAMQAQMQAAGPQAPYGLRTQDQRPGRRRPPRRHRHEERGWRRRDLDQVEGCRWRLEGRRHRAEAVSTIAEEELTGAGQDCPASSLSTEERLPSL